MAASKGKHSDIRKGKGVPMKRRAALTLLAAGAGGIFLLGGGAHLVSAYATTVGAGKKVTLYKDPQCGCCEGYADYLRSNGFDVTIVPTHDLPLLDDKYGIATELQPCHLSLIDGYVVGGHVPVEVVNRLLSERPKITGITLPGMPLGSPGMNGEKTAPFKIYEIAKGPPKLYAVV
jgi:hypothetical protein